MFVSCCLFVCCVLAVLLVFLCFDGWCLFAGVVSVFVETVIVLSCLYVLVGV